MPLQLSQDEPKRLRENHLLSARGGHHHRMNAVRLRHATAHRYLREMQARYSEVALERCSVAAQKENISARQNQHTVPCHNFHYKSHLSRRNTAGGNSAWISFR